MADLLDRSGPDPAALGLSELVELVNRPKPKSPWKGPSGPLLIAEIGGNHEGDFEVAKAMTENAIAAGADCVKFQIYQGGYFSKPSRKPGSPQAFQEIRARTRAACRTRPDVPRGGRALSILGLGRRCVRLD